ncbi:MAG: ABC transporter substrate-binding protein [Candidatus Rokuibacteriota bacterium]|nr:MAG: ABC transporter substrate-binding protein [Candidatus Rokubacteria bacterium]
MAQRLSRRAFLEVGVTSLAVAAVPTRVRAQAGAIRLGTLTPLTGSGGNYGPSMLKAMQWVAGEINAAGGVLGRKLELVSEDDQTNPEAGVRAARKLIDLDKVAAIMGTWASAVTTAVAPLCWESKTFLTTVSGSDTITLLPHQGYLVRTQPNTQLQGRKFAEFMVAQGSKRVGILAVQAPFALPTQKIVGEELRKHGAELVAAVVYDKDKTTFRSEIDQVLRARPDMLYLNGYTPDVTIVLKDLYKAGYTGAKIAQAYAVNQKLLNALPPEVTEGTFTIAPSPAIESAAYKRLAQALGNDDLDPYSCQTHDHISLVALAIAHAKGESTGTAIRDHVRKISQGSGAHVESAVEGLKRLAQGKEINFDGASGPCDFNEIGDILDTKFRYEQAEKGKFKLLKIA